MSKIQPPPFPPGHQPTNNTTQLNMPSESKPITIKLTDKIVEIRFVAFNDVPFESIFATYCEEQKKSFDELCFVFDRLCIRGHETPASVKMPSGAKVMVFQLMDSSPQPAPSSTKATPSFAGKICLRIVSNNFIEQYYEFAPSATVSELYDAYAKDINVDVDDFTLDEELCGPSENVLIRDGTALLDYFDAGLNYVNVILAIFKP
ncbi:hypothetical protein EJ05DRAFT_521870 [Pseudovirgaria hyperparasitica]|uniref:Rad60/SUMO-like domain-containing protein n=1 Tax=Pseudovirgaria hyperparasitica TaxID=470096 RepID=A0A6A6WHT6_9PEZI|nr:uncharacterized protein EJ05DRAFT_521870 [Pseudovirgaria hyperparasitica]KAF2761644.1 hypothetical protein EJ05DRAFT_521870 [Pseudovirgaria hyperparasitica]